MLLASSYSAANAFSSRLGPRTTTKGHTSHYLLLPHRNGTGGIYACCFALTHVYEQLRK